MDIPSLPHTARIIHLFPELSSNSLLSIGQLCDVGCNATFDNEQVTITYKNEKLLTGKRDHTTGLWMIPIPIQQPTTSHWQANLINATHKVKELVAFAHAALFSPSITTLRKAVTLNFLHDFPGLTIKSLNDFPPNTAATGKGHLDQKRQNVRPTQRPMAELPLIPITETPDSEDDAFPIDRLPARTHHCYTTTIATTQTGQIFTDQTGRFLTPAQTKTIPRPLGTW